MRARTRHARLMGIGGLLAATALIAGACGASGGGSDESGAKSTTTEANGTSTSTKWGDLDSPCGAWLVGGRGAVLRQVGDLHP